MSYVNSAIAFVGEIENHFDTVQDDLLDDLLIIEDYFGATYTFVVDELREEGELSLLDICLSCGAGITEYWNVQRGPI